MSLSFILLIVLILILIGALPSWGYSRSWGYGPSGVLGMLLVVLLVLLVLAARANVNLFAVGALAVAAGGASPPVQASLRALWPHVTTATQRDAAYSFDAPDPDGDLAETHALYARLR